MRLLIIDAMNLIRRVFAAVEQGELAIEATQTRCLAVIGRQADAWQASHLITVFEWPATTWRHQLWPDYKAGRAPMPQLLADALPGVLHYLEKNGVPCLSMDCWEADDVIASVALNAYQHRLDVQIMSTDKGFCQLVRPGIQIRNHFDRSDWDVTQVTDMYGLRPDQLVDFWALMGDTTNHLPGVAGIGRKTAAQLLDRFGSLDATLVQMESFGDERWAKQLQQDWRQALLTRLLVRLRTDLELGVSLKSMRWGG
ncbi:hypothetical protein CHH28_13805 [Bacterioplanes sanyensis]|uniref:5'-3' exonuclease domain-containing protein n=1 Tax=Bacterioplanes sanyensis TaxID=1249553 RepID=A0A222FMS8_9GAMM|nr:5'-3' exonuclease H3TH domain-containing protein [Bacterioplanes sanyensis]ASP39681.1 hypothetical protein CHH28_13805 [Bacterioplanes sanyensis]